MTRTQFWLRYHTATASLPAIVAVGPHVLAISDKVRVLKTRRLQTGTWALVDGEWRRK